MNEKLKKLREAMGRSTTEARKILDAADKDGGRALTAEERAKYDAHVKDVADARETINRVEEQDRLERAQAEPTRDPIRDKPSDGAGADPARRAAERRAVSKLLRGGPQAIGAEEYRALAVGADASGGFLQLPVEMSSSIITKVKDLTFMRKLATVYPGVVGEGLGVPTLETDVDDADWTSEIATGNEDSAMAFGKRELKPHPLAKLIKVSRKLVRSAALDVQALVEDRIAYKHAIPEEKAFLTGDGDKKPLGVFTASNDGISTGRDVSSGNSATSIGADGLIGAKMALKAAYRIKAQWLFHRDALTQIMKLKDGDGRYIWQPGLVAGQPDKLLNLPYNESEYAPNTFTSGLYAGIVGDFSNYWIADALQMEIQVLLELYARTNQIGYIARKETDGMPVLEEAFARVKLA